MGIAKADVLVENFALKRIEKQAEDEEDKEETAGVVEFEDGLREGSGMWGTVEK